MARQPGLNNFAGTLEVLAGGPLDARTVVPTKEDLTSISTFSYPYVGMIVSVESEGKAYILRNINNTNIDNWKELGAFSDSNVIWGYYNASDDTFYENITRGEVTESGLIKINYINPITPNYECIYLDRRTKKTYLCEEFTYNYIEITEPYRFTYMPIIPRSFEDDVDCFSGRVVQYVGDNNPPYKTGYFYQCVDNPSDPTHFMWKELEVQPHGVRQYETLPNTFGGSDGAQVGDIVQYIGETDEYHTNGYFYKCIKIGENPSNYTWEQINTQPGGGGQESSLTTAVTSNLTVGAIASGTTLAQGTTFTEFVQKLLITEIAPTIGFSMTKSGNVLYGDSYTETLTLNVSAMGTAKKIKTIAWYEGSTLLQTDTIDSTTTGSWTYTMSTATTDTTTFKAVVTYTKADDVDTSVTKTSTINFYYNKFYGAVASLTPNEATVEALSTALGTGKGGTYTYTVTDGRLCYAYPSSLGALTSIKDGNGFSLFDSFTRTTQTYTQNSTSVSYYLYVLTDATSVSNYSVTFA